MLGSTLTNTSPTTSDSDANLRQAVARALSQDPADRFVLDLLTLGVGAQRGCWDVVDVQSRLSKPEQCLRNIYDHYAFSRRGKDRNVVAGLACKALDSAIAEAGGFRQVKIDAIWHAFEMGCIEANRKSQFDLNHGVITGLAELAQAIDEEFGMSLAKFTASAANTSGRVEPIFFRLVELRGVGPKVASTLLRDWAYVFEAEESIINRDAIYLQPIDRWMRLIAPKLLEESEAADFPDWILAGKLGKAARQAGVSGIRMNMGVSWIGHEASQWNGGDGRFHELVQSLSSAQVD